MRFTDTVADTDDESDDDIISRMTPIPRPKRIRTSLQAAPIIDRDFLDISHNDDIFLEAARRHEEQQRSRGQQTLLIIFLIVNNLNFHI